MKMLLILMVFLLFLIKGIGQNVIKIEGQKFKKVYAFLDSAIKNDNNTDLNVCSEICAIRPSLLEDQLSKINDSIVPNEIRNWRNFSNLFYYESFKISDFDTAFVRSKTSAKYVIFSKPIKNILIAEVRSGNYIIEHPTQHIYYGVKTDYLFFFDESNDIKKVIYESADVN